MGYHTFTVLTVPKRGIFVYASYGVIQEIQTRSFDGYSE